MASCTVNSCCCGCTLEQGTLIIGWLSLVGSAAQAITYALSAHNDGFAGYWGSFSISVLGVSMALLLIFGAKKKEPNHLKIWIIIEIFLLLSDFLLAIAIAIMTGFFALIIITAAINLLNVYFIVVVLSYALKLVEERNATFVQANTYQQPYPVYFVNDGAKIERTG